LGCPILAIAIADWFDWFGPGPIREGGAIAIAIGLVLLEVPIAIAPPIAPPKLPNHSRQGIGVSSARRRSRSRRAALLTSRRGNSRAGAFVLEALEAGSRPTQASKRAVNRPWKVPPRPSGWRRTAWTNFPMSREPPPLARPPARLLQGLAFLPAKVVDTQIGQARVCQLRQPE
jgi:hypothetical protein